MFDRKAIDRENPHGVLYTFALLHRRICSVDPADTAYTVSKPNSIILSQEKSTTENIGFKR